MTTFTSRVPTNPNQMRESGFSVSIQKLPNLEFFADTITTPSVTLGVIDGHNPLMKDKIPGDQIDLGDLEIDFKIDEDFETFQEIYNWMRGIGFPENHQDFVDLTQSSAFFPEGELRSDLTITTLTSAGNPNLRFKFRDAFPINLAPFTLTSNTAGDEYITCSVSFAFSGAFDIENISA